MSHVVGFASFLWQVSPLRPGSYHLIGAAQYAKDCAAGEFVHST
ncbi:hypothetical protein SAMN05421773_13025 [Streptomyces aidingensis]|uniref:Uncharacterized protein n=1 Tax=Streptomyces aidingensis TaxID=910347 RepID=A0A1I1VCW7_9ACTN|nr:hypothetical protein SAMN05421773_13025 [Streptomyces aidingensis]